MPRHKKAKRANNRQTMNNLLAAVQKMEKSLIKAPAKLAGQLAKQIKLFTKQEAKLNKAVTQISHKLLKAESRLRTAEEEKNQIGGKNPFKTAKKAYIELSKAHKALAVQLVTAEKSLASHLDAHLKITALNKHLGSFDKSWTKQPKNSPKTLPKTSSKPLVSPEKTKRKMKGKVKNEPSVIEQAPSHQTADPDMAHLVVDEAVS